MKKLGLIFTATLLLLVACVNNEEDNIVTLKFTHNWEGTPVTNQDFNAFKFTNANGEKISIDRLRYVVSNLNFTDGRNYHLVDVGENTGTLITLQGIAPGSYNLKFRFGFLDAENQDGVYKDLNTVNFNVPTMLGGGYHYMQFDGKYLDTNAQEANFNYHAIRAVDRSNPDNFVFEDTSFEVDFGQVMVTNNGEIEIKMNIAEWFKNPNIWNLNELNTVLMPNFEAQKLMNSNGKSVFSLGEVN